MSIFDKLASVDLSEVDTSYPILEAGTWEFQIKSAEKKTSENTGGEYLLFQCSLVSSNANDITGAPLNPGYSMRHMINLTPSAKQIENKGEAQCEKDIFADVCKFLDAIQAEREWDETLESYVGLTFYAKTKVGKERTDPKTGNTYAAQAEFAGFLPFAG